ncbi:MAG: HNH endonuclease [Burkholderiales bacterium]|nr:MAG: HNH endonuclease [Burkholderiales bacterium]
MRFDELLGRETIGSLLARAGVKPAFIQPHRSFTSRWAWDDGTTAVATVWREELANLDTIPWREYSDPRDRKDLVGSRRTSALEHFDLLVRHLEQPIRVILQRRQADETKWAAGVSKGRGLDPEPWFPTREGDRVILQRGSARVATLVSLDGQPMVAREPRFSARETRPNQIEFRRLVAVKSNNRCALTGAPSEVCDAAHFPWCDWREHNQACHGTLLRRDIHAALDAGLLDITEDGSVSVSTRLAEAFPPYAELHGKRVAV